SIAAIGIDLGTTYSCAAISENGKVTTIPNSFGYHTTPSIVAFVRENQTTIGPQAKKLAHSNPVNTIFDVKRLIGRRFEDQDVQKDMKLWPFKVVNKSGSPMIQIPSRHNGTLH